MGGYCRRYLGTRNLENPHQKYRENQSLQMTMIGALVPADYSEVRAREFRFMVKVSRSRVSKASFRASSIRIKVSESSK